MDTHEEYRRRMTSRLVQMDAEIDRLERRLKHIAAQTTRQYQEQIDSLREKLKQAERHMHEMKDAADPARKDLRTGFEKAWHELRSAVDSVVERFI